MSDEPNANGPHLFELTITLNETLFNGKQYKAAYCALATGYHIAIDSKDLEQLRQVKNIAQNQSASVNQQALNNPYRTLYKNLAASAKIRVLLAQSHKEGS